ncbi:MAG: MFS transporter [Deltaproteobacteria bacterium]|nr:MFS transporter [Deltaproteobacteria bacterium]
MDDRRLSLRVHSPAAVALQINAYRRAFVGDALSMGGDWFTYVAMSLLAVHASHSALALAMVASAHTLPRLLLASWAGALCDRLDRRTILVTTQLVRGAIVAAMAGVCLLAKGAPVGASLAMLHVLHLARMALGALTDAAFRASLVDWVGVERLAWAHRRAGLAWSALFCVGVLLGGVTVAAVGVVVAFAIDAVSYLLCAALDATLPPLPPPLRDHAVDSPDEPNESRRKHLRLDRVLAAWVSTHPALVRALIAKVPFALAQGAVWVVLTVRAPMLAMGLAPAAALGALHCARGAGAGLGPWALRGLATGDGLGLAVLALPVATLFVLATDGRRASIALFVFGLAAGASWVQSSAVVAARAPLAYRGRVASAELAVNALAQWMGSLIVCVAIVLAGQTAGPRWAVSAGAVAAIVLATVTALWARRLSR